MATPLLQAAVRISPRRRAPWRGRAVQMLGGRSAHGRRESGGPCSRPVHVRSLLATAIVSAALLAPVSGAGAQDGGLGMVITIRQSWVAVVHVLPGSPAEQAGVRDGDRIVRVGSESTHLRSLAEVVQWIRGAPGTEVDVYVRRLKPDGAYSQQTRRLRVRRALLRMPIGAAP